MRLIDLAKILKISSVTINSHARDGKFKTSHKVFEDHRNVWYIGDEEANLLIKTKNESKRL